MQPLHDLEKIIVPCPQIYFCDALTPNNETLSYRGFFDQQENVAILQTITRNKLQVLTNHEQSFSQRNQAPSQWQEILFGEPIYSQAWNNDHGSWHEESKSAQFFYYPMIDILRVAVRHNIDSPQKRIFNRSTQTTSFFKVAGDYEVDTGFLTSIIAKNLPYFA